MDANVHHGTLITISINDVADKKTGSWRMHVSLQNNAFRHMGC